MKKSFLLFCLGLFSLLSITGTFAQEGFTGPGSDPASRGQQAELITVGAAQNLRDDTRVTLQGTIVRRSSHEKYIFRDSTGEITLEIDRKVWRGLTVGENDLIEIYGEVDVDRRGTEIDVKTIKKL